MNLILITAFIAVCGAAKLDRTYLPPSAASAGGSPGSLHTPLTRTSEVGKSNTPLESHTSPGSSNAPLTRTSEQGTFNNPSGSYTNDFGGVVVEAVAPGTRSSEGISGLGSPRLSYGTSNSKVGDAAFRNSAGFRGFEATGQLEQSAGQLHNGNSFQSNKAIDDHSAQRFPSIEQINTQTQFSFSDNENRSERPQAAKDRSSNILSITNDVNVDSYSYGFETDNGIVVDENGVDINGLQAEGGYSYQGDDGQVYKVTYVADEKGYRPQGAHLPTPPPIPKEILKSLEQNAKDEAAGLVDDGSYDAQKYNAESDYTHDNSDNNQHNGGQSTQLVKRPVSTFNQNNKAFVAESPNSGFTSQDVNGQSSQASGNADIRKPYTISSQENPGQHGISQTSYNGQSQVNRQHGSAQFGSQTHSAFGQTNQFNYNSDVAKNEYNSHSSQSSNGNAGSTGQADEKLGNRFSSSVQNQDAIGSPSQIGSQFGQSALPSANFQSQPYQSGSRRQDNFGQASSLSTPSTNKYSKISLDSSSSSSLPESGTSFKPQGSEAFSGASLNQNQDAQDFGKPFPQMFSGENFNRPASGNFNKPQTGQNQVNRGSVTYNRLSQSGQLVAQKEYLPPYNNSPLPTKSQVSDLTIQSSGLESQNNNIPNFVPLNRPKPNFASATASTSFNQPQTNAFDTKPKLNQFTQQIGSTQQSSQLSSEYNTKAQESAFASQTVSDISTKPTTVPDTDLTTPLEPNENSQGPQFSSQTTSNFGQFGSKLNQGKTQFELQDNSAIVQSTGQTLSHSTSSVNSQLSTATQPAFQTSMGTGLDNSNVPQFPQNSFSQSQSSTQVDDSYYYNQPSKAFGPGMRNQGLGFSNSPSYQSNGVAQKQFLNQQRFQTFAPVQPTAATQLPSRQSQGYSGITQAAISSFPSLLTQSSQAVMTHSQFGSGFNQQSSIGNQNLPGAQPSNIQQTTISSNQKIENQKPLISNLPIGRYPPGSQLDNPGNQIHSTGMKHTNNQQPNNGNTQDINIHMTGQLSNQQTIPSLPMRRFPPNLQFGLVGNQAPLTRVKPSYNQSSFSNTAVTTADLFGKLQTGQPASTFSQTETQFEISKTSEPLESSSQSTQTQQYQGTIYEYNKPAEVLPAAQTDSSSGQISISSESKPSLEQSLSSQSFSEQNLKQFSQNHKINNSGFSAQSNKGESSSSSFQFGQQAQAQNIQGSPVSQSEDFEVQPAKPFNAPSTNGQFSQSSQSGKPYGALSASVKFAQTGQLTKDDSTLQNNLGQSDQSFKPFGSGQSSQSPFVTKTQFGKQTGQFSQTQTTQSFGTAQPEQISSQFQSSMQNSESAEGNGYFYPRNPKPQFVEQTQFHSEPSRTQTSSMSNQINSAQPINSQSNSYNHQSQFSATPQFGFDTNKNIQATFGQRQTNTNQQFESQYPLASSQGFASGQGIASASASTYNPKPFSSQDRTQFSQTELNSYDQSGQGTQVGAQSAKPFENQDSKPQSSRPFGTSPQGSKLFKSACCQASKDSSSHQTDGPTSSFPGAISNSQAFAGNGEVFGGPRKPPMFDDQTGYHY